MVAGTDWYRVAYVITDAILQPVRKPGWLLGRLLRRMRRRSAQRREVRQRRNAPAAGTSPARRRRSRTRSAIRDQRTHGVDPVLRAWHRLDHVDRGAGQRPLPAGPGGALSRLS